MSGGYFSHDQFRITDIAEEVAQLIRDNNKQDENGYSTNFSPATIDKFVEAERTLRLASMMAHRIDWLVSGDDGEDTFHQRWEDELSKKGES